MLEVRQLLGKTLISFEIFSMGQAREIVNAIGVNAASECIRKVLDIYVGSLQKASFHFMHEFFIRNHFILSLVLDSLKFKKLLELQGKS